MIRLMLLPKLFLAGGVFLGAFEAPPAVPLMNHTLAGEEIPASQVVCRSRWGTPMLPDWRAGYSLIAPIRKKLIAQSLWIPPVSGTRPETPVTTRIKAPRAVVMVEAPASPVTAKP